MVCITLASMRSFLADATKKKKTRRLTTNTKFMNHLGLHPSPKTVALNLHHDNNKKVISIKGVLQREKLQKKKTLQTLLKPTANILAERSFPPHCSRSDFPRDSLSGQLLAPSRDDDDEDISSQKTFPRRRRRRRRRLRLIDLRILIYSLWEKTFTPIKRRRKEKLSDFGSKLLAVSGIVSRGAGG